MPQNFLLIGMIRAALPHAKVIHCQRDPRDAALSTFSHLFEGEHPYAYDLKELGAYFLLYKDLMAHWRERPPGVIHEVRYEDLSASPDTEIPALLEACGLRFDPACLAFHANRRRVKTASLAQVRQPMHTRSAARWRHYEKGLQPLLDILAED